MFAAGYVNVVGTMWSIRDEDGPIVAGAFFAALRADLQAGKDAKMVHALHGAVKQLRMMVGDGGRRAFEMDPIRAFWGVQMGDQMYSSFISLRVPYLSFKDQIRQERASGRLVRHPYHPGSFSMTIPPDFTTKFHSHRRH